MGCGTSKNQVHDVSEPVLNGGKPVDRRANSGNKKKNAVDVDTCSMTSLERGGSATSKASRHSGDSGFNDEDEQRQRDSLLRRPLPPLGGKSEAKLMEEKQVLETLQEEGLIPIGRGAFGAVSFQVMSEFDGSIRRRPPPRLAKLEHKKKKKKALTQEEIQQKLDKAEQRRKEVEQQRIDKIHSLYKADISTSASVDTQQQQQRGDGSGDEPVVKTREEIVAENRERKLREKLEKLRAKEAHAEQVRQRKLAALMNSVGDGDEIARNEDGL